MNMNSRFHLATWSAKSLLTVLLMMTVLLCGCASGPQKPPQASANAAEPAVKKLTEDDTRSYQKALESLGQEPEDALQLLTELAQNYPLNAAIKTNLALAHYQCGEHQQALEVSDKAIQLDTDIAENYNLRGLILMEQNRFSEAEKAFLAALERNPRLALAHYNLGLLHDVYFQNIAEALRHYELYLAAYPKDTDTAAWIEQLKRSLEKE